MPTPSRASSTITHADALALLEIIPDGLILLDGDWRCLFINRPVEAFLRRGREEVIGRPVWDVLATPADTDFTARLQRAVAERREAVLYWASPGGCAAKVYVLPGADSVALLLRRDPVPRPPKRAFDGRLETRLLHAQKMEAVGRLAGGVAHDFNNLLTVIQSYGDFVAADLPPGSTARADMDEVLKAAHSAANLTRQLLAFSRKQVLQPRRLDARLTLTRVVGMLHRVLGEDIRIVTDFGSAASSVLVDPGQLEQVVINLALNARDAMPDGGTLHLRAATVPVPATPSPDQSGLAPGIYVSIVVEDTGVGMAPDVMAQIFEPFYTTKGDGTGLGLATVRGIVRQCGGDVNVESAPGRGSRFTVLLPFHPEDGCDTAPPATAVAAVAGGPVGGAETILVVEDEEPVRAVIRRMLERLGYTVREAANSGDALSVVAALPEPPDLVLTDLIMPGQSGPALAAQLAERWPALKVLFMSGYTEEEVRRRWLLEPGMAFLEKPITFELIGRAIRDALDGAAAA